MLKKVRLIYNPFSGGGKILRVLDEIFEVYQEHGYIVDVVRLTYKCDQNIILNEIDEYSHILISGGDGTINQILNVLKNAEKDIPIAILPLGTSNDFARHLKISPNIRETCKKIIEGDIKEIDLGKINDRYFINIASYGLFTNVSQGTDIGIKKLLGRYSYFITGIKELKNLKYLDIEIEVDDEIRKEKVLGVFILNGTSAGHLNLGRNASVDDGYLDVIILKPKNIVEALDIAAKLLSDFVDVKKVPGVTYLQIKKISIKGEGPETDLDGEKGPKLPIEVSCIERGLKLLGV